MKDETYVFISDVKEKGSVGRSARHRKTHAGKGGRVRLPSDNLSKKELMKMSGECKSYRLNEPMAWKEFRSMPDDIKVTYIKLLREKFDVPDCELYKMFGTDKDTLSRYFKKLNLRVPRKNVHREWKKDEWFAWVHGVEQLPTPVPEEKVVTEDIPDRLYSLEEAEAFIEEPVHVEMGKSYIVNQEDYVEDDLPFEEPEFDPVVEFRPFTAVPETGSMIFKCPADRAMKTLEQLLGQTNCAISIMWRVIEDGGEDNETDKP